MATEDASRAERVAGWVLLVAAVPLFWAVAQARNGWAFAAAPFLLAHTAAEVFSVVLAMLVFVAGWRAILEAREGAVVLLGVGFLGVGILDFLHAVSYAGMPDAITPNSSHKSMFFWLAARGLAAIALLTYVRLADALDITTRRRRAAVSLVGTLVAIAAAVGLWMPQSVPPLFDANTGLTPLKVGLEWVLVALHLAALVLLWLRRAHFRASCLQALAFSLALSAQSELFFTQLGLDDLDAANALGHAYKIAAYVFLLRATFVESVLRPLSQLQQQHLREKVVLDAAPDGVLWVTATGQIVLANPAMATLTGYSREELVGQQVGMLLAESLREGHSHSMQRFFKAPEARAMGSQDLAILRRDGTALPVDISLGHWRDGGNAIAIAYVRDLRERKQFEHSLRHQASHDELTGLPNRWLFNLQLNQTLSRCQRSDSRAALLFLDLDYFKNINDTFGHATGDALLVQVAQRLRTQLREGDVLARLGGDEFAVLLADVTGADEAAHVAGKLLDAMQLPFSIDDRDIHSGASLGIAFFPEDAQDSTTLLRFADMAMYQAKHGGRGRYACYSEDMDRKVRDDMQVYVRLKSALDHGGLELHYQPQVDVPTGRIVGAEALLRWNDAELGSVSPLRFVPVAETMGLILPLTQWVLDTACRQLAQWHTTGTPLRVAVNVSAQQLRQGNLHDTVQQALARCAAPAALLDIEITETAAMAQPDLAQAQLGALVALGCRVSLDDFGTGYSSLSHLKNLPVSTLKIDHRFTSGLPEDTDDAAICRAIVALAHSLGLTLVAEGVETPEQLAFLHQCGCETYQGWLFARAMPAEALTAMLQVGPYSPGSSPGPTAPTAT